MTNLDKKSQLSESGKKEFWERCGFKWSTDTMGDWKDCTYWHNPPDTEEWGATWLPEIDLNNLFKYAVPKLSYLSLDGFWNGDENCFNYAATVGTPEGEYKEHEYYKDPALALFWAIWEVIKK